MAASIHPRSHVRSMADADGAVLLDLEKGKYFSLNAVGMEIWNAAERGSNHSEILTHLQETFCAPLERLREDLDRFVQTLDQKGLIRVD